MVQGPLLPLPSYMPVTSSVQQVPSNPFAQSQLAAIGADALAPALSYAPPGQGTTTLGYVSSSYVPAQNAATAAYSRSASNMMASVQPQTVVSCNTLAAPP